jgi:hypothetical protein
MKIDMLLSASPFGSGTLVLVAVNLARAQVLLLYSFFCLSYVWYIFVLAGPFLGQGL